MRSRVRLVLVGLVVALTGCSGPTDPPPEPDPHATSDVPARTSWALSHRVKESDTIRITGGNIGHYDEATYLSLGQDANGLDTPCYVTVFVPGQGGPKTMVGEKVPTTVNGSPGFRNGPGAETAYLMWRHRRGAWTMAHCSGSDHERFLEGIADAVVFRRSSIKLPFGLDSVPDEYGLSSVTADETQGTHVVYLGLVNPAFGHAEADVEISYQTGVLTVSDPIGRPMTVNGRPAVVSENREAPGVCVAVQQRWICVRAYVSDTGPYPDRTDEIPVLVGLAESLRFAADLDDRSTWLNSSDLPA